MLILEASNRQARASLVHLLEVAKRPRSGLRRSPRHWYNKILAVLNSLGLKANASDPCLFTGSIVDPSNPAAGIPMAPLTLGIYVDDFVCFSKNPEVEH
jgi:hypothetical protein